MIRNLITLGLILALLYFCEEETKNLMSDDASEGAQNTDMMLDSAETNLTIDSSENMLEAYLWRNFMPATPTQGSGLIWKNTLTKMDSNVIPDYIERKKQYVVKNNFVWATRY